MIRSVLLAPLNYDHPQTGQVQAFEGVFGPKRVVTYDYLQAQRRGGNDSKVNFGFYEAAVKHKPDWIWMQLQDTKVLHASTLKRIRKALPEVVITHWTGDARPSISPYLASIGAETDLTLISSIGQIPAYRAAGAKDVRYCQIGLDFAEDVLGEPAWEPPFRVPDVVFCGGYYGATFAEGTADRARAVKALKAAGIDVGVVGTGWPADFPVVGQCTVKQQHHVWRRAKVALSVNHFNSIERYYSDRQLIAMASGVPVVCRHVPGLEREFIDGTHCVFFHNEVALVEDVQRLLADEPMRRRIGAAGRAKVIREHTWHQRVLDLLPEIEALQAARRAPAPPPSIPEAPR